MLNFLGSIAAPLIGGLFNNRRQDQQSDLQREFAQNGIRWKVADAEAAGIHPLAALGAQTTPYQPVSIGGGLDVHWVR